MSVRKRINGKHGSYSGREKRRNPLPLPFRVCLSLYSRLVPADYLPSPPTPPHGLPTNTRTAHSLSTFFILSHNPSLSLQLGTANWSRLYYDMGTWHNCWTNSEAFSFRPVSTKLYTDTSRLESPITTPVPQLANWQILPTKEYVYASVHAFVCSRHFLSWIKGLWNRIKWERTQLHKKTKKQYAWCVTEESCSDYP